MLVEIILRSPLFAGLVTSVFVSLVFPLLWRRHKASGSSVQAKLEIAKELIDRNPDISRKLNSMLTTLEIFHKENVASLSGPKDYGQQQERLREILNTAYMDFDSVAWFWYWYLPKKSLSIYVSDEEMKVFQDFGNKYEANLKSSIEALNGFWNTCVAIAYNPAKEAITEEMKNARSRLEELAEGRQVTLLQYVYAFCQTKGASSVFMRWLRRGGR